MTCDCPESSLNRFDCPMCDRKGLRIAEGLRHFRAAHAKKVRQLDKALDQAVRERLAELIRRAEKRRRANG
jgi:hypothetical protein